MASRPEASTPGSQVANADVQVSQHISKPGLNTGASSDMNSSSKTDLPERLAPKVTVEAAQQDGEDDGDGGKGNEEHKVNVEDGEKKKKKKKKKNNKSAAKTGTGFEDFHADRPMTVDEHKEEQAAYASTVPFAERIEECIQRWRAKRRLDNRRKHVFDKYLMVGGVEAGVRQFTGFDPEAAEDAMMNKDEIRVAAATDFVNTGGNEIYYMNNGDWTVDFAGVAAGFFSTVLPNITAYDPEQTVEGVNLIENFLNYVVYHRVCPEYEANVQEARRICELAREEVLATSYLFRYLPGKLNNTLSKIFDSESDAMDSSSEPVTAQELHSVGTALHTWAGSDVANSVLSRPRSSRPVDKTRRDVEIIDISSADKPLLEPGHKNYNGERPLVCLTVRNTFIEDGYSSTLTQEQWEAKQKANPTAETFKLWIDDDPDCRAQLRVKQKLTIVVMRVEGDFHILAETCAVYPSFYVFLPQTLMIGWKKPGPNTRKEPRTTKNIQNWLESGEPGFGFDNGDDDIDFD